MKHKHQNDVECFDWTMKDWGDENISDRFYSSRNSIWEIQKF
jgi:hypothetical protein